MNTNGNTIQTTTFAQEKTSQVLELKVQPPLWFVYRYKALTPSVKNHFRMSSLELFFPHRKVHKAQNGTAKAEYRELPIIPGYIFVYAGLDDAINLGKEVDMSPWRRKIPLQVDKSKIMTVENDLNQYREYLYAKRTALYYSVDNDTMRQFIRAVEINAQDFKLLAADCVDLGKDDFVEIITGKYKGYKGYLKSVNGSNGGLVIIPLLKESPSPSTVNRSRRSLLHYGIPASSSEVAILSFAKGSHRATDQLSHAAKVVDRLLEAYSSGEEITSQQSIRLLGYVHRFRKVQLESLIQRTNLALLLYRAYTILELTTEMQAVRKTLETEILPECERRMLNAANRDKASSARTYHNCISKKEEADNAVACRRMALNKKHP